MVTGFLNGGAPIGALGPAVFEAKTFDKPTWRLSLDHKVGDTMVYASYNRGFKSGGFNAQILNSPPLVFQVPLT